MSMLWNSVLRVSCCRVGTPASALEVVSQPRLSSLPKLLMQCMLACTGKPASLQLPGKESTGSPPAMRAVRKKPKVCVRLSQASGKAQLLCFQRNDKSKVLCLGERSQPPASPLPGN